MLNKIVVSGATSMIGAALTEACVSRGARVYAVVRQGSDRIGRLPKSPLVHVLECDLPSLHKLGQVESADVFYHFAWAGTDRSLRDDPQTQQENIRYTLDAVNVAKRAGCRRFVFAGSQAEFGPHEGVIGPDTKPQRECSAACFASNTVWSTFGAVFSAYTARWITTGPCSIMQSTAFSRGRLQSFPQRRRCGTICTNRMPGKCFISLVKKAEQGYIASPILNPGRFTPT